MEAHVVEAAQAIRIAEDDDGVVADLCGDEVTVRGELVAPPHELPRVREDPLSLELEIDGIVVETRGNCRGALDVRVERKDERHESGLGAAGKLVSFRERG